MCWCVCLCVTEVDLSIGNHSLAGRFCCWLHLADRNDHVTQRVCVTLPPPAPSQHPPPPHYRRTVTLWERWERTNLAMMYNRGGGGELRSNVFRFFFKCSNCYGPESYGRNVNNTANWFTILCRQQLAAEWESRHIIRLGVCSSNLMHGDMLFILTMPYLKY